MTEPNYDPSFNYGMPKEDWEHVFALSRKYSLVKIYQMFVDVEQQSKDFELHLFDTISLTLLERESTASSASQWSSFVSSGDSSRGSFASSGYDSRASLVSNSSVQSCGSHVGNTDTSSYSVNYSRLEQNLLSNMSTPGASVQGPVVPPKPFFCTYCAELGLTTTFGRKRDWKVHELEFHNAGREWPCCACSSVFDRFKDFDKHFKNAHPETNRPAIADFGVQLQPKQVFACGFSGCRELLTSLNDRFQHVAHHMEKRDAKRNQWHYSIVILNLLRQPGIKREWKTFLDQHSGTENLVFSWNPRSSRKLRQKLECQDFSPDVQSLVVAAWILRSAGPIHSTSSYDQFLQNVLRTPIMNTPFRDAFHAEPPIYRQPPLAQNSQPTDAYFMRGPESFPLPELAMQDAQFSGSEDVSNHVFENFIQPNLDVGSVSAPDYPTMVDSPAVNEATRLLHDDPMTEFPQDPILDHHNTAAQAIGPILTAESDQSGSRPAFQFHGSDDSSPMKQHGQDSGHGTLRGKWRLRSRSHKKAQSEPQDDGGHNASPVPQVPQTVPLHIPQHQSPPSPDSLPDA